MYSEMVRDARVAPAENPDPFVAESRLLHRAKNPDTQENFAAQCRLMNQIGSDAGAIYSKPWKPRVVFYLPTGAKLAHTDNLLTFLRGHDQIGKPLHIEVWCGGALSDQFKEAFKGYHFRGFGVDPFDETKNLSPLQKWLAIQKYGRDMHIDAMIHVSAVEGLAFASTIRCAKAHVWWAMKWHGLFDNVDGYIDGNNPFHTEDHPPWISTYTALPEFERPDLEPFDERPTFGVFGRTEKYSPAFIDTINRLLASDPNYRLVYAAREEIQGFGNQARYLGWLSQDDLTRWIKSCSVVLDTFPFPGGHTTWTAIANKRPIVTMRVEKGPQHFAAELIGDYAGTPLVIARDPEHYVLLAKNQAKAPLEVEYLHAFYKNQMRDERRMATELVSAIERINGKRAHEETKADPTACGPGDA